MQNETNGIKLFMYNEDSESDELLFIGDGNKFIYKAPQVTPVNHGWVGIDSNGEQCSFGDDMNGNGLEDGHEYKVECCMSQTGEDQVCVKDVTDGEYPDDE